MGKSDRAFWVGLLAVLLAFGIIGPRAAGTGFVFLTISGVWTVLNRSRQALLHHHDKTD